ncbi:MAG: hypothetical protein EOP51_01580 [Sphingobacteriales bacterium]|nr:MAG: hypothetical protein EOP51_01580 [Sphingobacteriales bacterium]
MKSVWLSKVLFIAAVSLAIVSCDKEKTTIENPPVVGGKGGHAWLSVVPRHEKDDVDSAWIYIKYNTLDIPQHYDDSQLVVRVDGRPRAIFTDLKQGDYYIYGRGWDNNRSLNVAGGFPFTIKSEGAKDNMELQLFR